MGALVEAKPPVGVCVEGVGAIASSNSVHILPRGPSPGPRLGLPSLPGQVAEGGAGGTPAGAGGPKAGWARICCVSCSGPRIPIYTEGLDALGSKGFPRPGFLGFSCAPHLLWGEPLPPAGSPAQTPGRCSHPSVPPAAPPGPGTGTGLPGTTGPSLL